MRYDDIYKSTKDYFGSEPVRILKDYCHLLNKSKPVLDIGAGQGRNAIFLANKGFTIDAIDNSKAAVDFVSRVAKEKKLSINTFNISFDDFTPDADFYSGILVFGLIQILSWPSIHFLIKKINDWTKKGSLIFISAFTIEDPSFARSVSECKNAGKSSFTDADNNFRTYLEPGEILSLFEGYDVIHHWEGLGPEHRHGSRPPERHASAKAVFQRR